MPCWRLGAVLYVRERQPDGSLSRHLVCLPYCVVNALFEAFRVLFVSTGGSAALGVTCAGSPGALRLAVRPASVRDQLSASRTLWCTDTE